MNWFAAGSLFAGAGVMLGAFGAHGLKSRLSPELLAVFETGVRYQMFHALALLAVAWAATRWSTVLVEISGWMFVGGIILFSGTLYLLALTGVRWLGAITPVGGLLLILGWLLLAIASLRGV